MKGSVHLDGTEPPAARHNGTALLASKIRSRTLTQLETTVRYCHVLTFSAIETCPPSAVHNIDSFVPLPLVAKAGLVAVVAHPSVVAVRPAGLR